MDAGLDSNPKIVAAGRAGREVFLFLLRRNALLGVDGELPISNIDPAYLARQLDMPVTEARNAVVTIVTVGLIVTDDAFVRFKGWEEGWKGPLSNAARQAAFRERKGSKPPESGAPVTKSNDESRSVTKSNRLRGEERREEKKREEGECEGGTVKAKPRRRRSQAPEVPLPGDWSPTKSHADRAKENNIDLADQAVRFRLHAETHGRLAASWNAAFTTWLMNAPGFTAGIPAKQSPPSLPLEPYLYDGYAISKQLEAEEKARREGSS